MPAEPAAGGWAGTEDAGSEAVGAPAVPAADDPSVVDEGMAGSGGVDVSAPADDGGEPLAAEQLGMPATAEETGKAEQTGKAEGTGKHAKREKHGQHQKRAKADKAEQPGKPAKPKKPAKADSKKPVKADSKKPVKADSKKPVKADSKKPVKADKAEKADKAARDAARRVVAEQALLSATSDWRAAKKRERAARDSLAGLVRATVAEGVLTENKIATVTDIPRMTIRKMLGKGD
ncbi:MAG: hypothetical protein KGP10_05190 [Actinomycetales bacterium]|nr:hypothetical protein [Actinomycetales bacterium]